MKGVPQQLPLWAQLMAMAGGDPLRAQEMEEQLTLRWWQHGKDWAEMEADVAKEAARKMKSGQK